MLDMHTQTLAMADLNKNDHAVRAEMGLSRNSFKALLMARWLLFGKVASLMLPWRPQIACF